MTTLILFLAGVMGALTPSFGGATSTFHEEFHRTYALHAQGCVTLENINGDVRITAWDRNEVRVEAVTRAGSQELLDDSKVVVDAAPDAISIHTSYSAQEDPDHPSSVDFSVMVPRAARLERIKVMNGTLEISGVRGEVRASSMSGSIRTRNLAGDVRLATVSGRLEAMFDTLDVTKSISMNSISGPIEVLLPLDARACFRADTVAGGIHDELEPLREFGHPAGRHLSRALKGGGASIRVSNVNGSIRIAAVWHGKRVKFT